eukprot:INCI3608.2.p1 GENE.INCI3608.2~~INCI3608.2.p1  ORF type:complete len:168 (+),score=19.44 INCI3608.2:454-957(+)
MIRVTRDGGEGLVYVWALKDRNSAATDETRRKNPLRKKLASPEDGDSQVSGKVDDASRDSTSNPSAIARSQEVMVPWHLQKAYLPSVEDTATDTSLAASIAHGAPDLQRPNTLVFRRYCHLFVPGELEACLQAAAAGLTSSDSQVSIEILRAFSDGENLCVHWRRCP